MDVKTLLETPHRSVHWAFVNKLRANTASSDPTQCFAEWRKLLSWEVASKAPHVFNEATSQLAQLAISGRVDLLQAAQVFADMVVVPSLFTDSVSGAEVVSAMCQALVRLLAAGADLLVHSPGASPRDNILRPALERNPSAWTYVLLCIRGCICQSNGAGVDSEAQGFETMWTRVSRFMRYAAIDPTVPAWAQGQTMHVLIDAMREWASSDSPAGRQNALLILDWAINMGLDAVEPLALSSNDASATYYKVDLQGRWTRHRLLAACAEVVQIIYDSLSKSGQKSDRLGAAKLHKIIDHLRLVLASMVCREPLSNSAASRAHAAPLGYDVSLTTALIAKLSHVAHALAPETSDIRTDAVLWSLAASQLARATTRAEQDGLLAVIEATMRKKALMRALPAPITALARFPLMCVATDGFDPDLCSRALRLCEDIDQMASPSNQQSADAICGLQHSLNDLSATQWMSRQLIVHISALRDYLSLYTKLYSEQGARGDGAGPLQRVFRYIDPIACQPVLIAPLLFEWDLLADVDDGCRSSLPLIALAHLLRLASSIASLRLSLLPFFVCALKHPDCPPKLTLALILQAIPSLASTHDAFATVRIVSVVSGLWKYSSNTLSSANASTPLVRRRMRCLAIRAWGNVVIHNPRVWRDLKPVVVQFVESIKAVQTKAREPEYEWAVLITVRDLVTRAPDRYADQVLPLVYSLLNFALGSLSASSTALLVDIACICVESDMASVRSVWTTIVSKPAMLWLSHSDRAGDAAAPVLECLARFLKLVATHGEASDTYAAFRQQILREYVSPMCANLTSGIAEPTQHANGNVADGVFSATKPRTRDLFLSALAAYPTEELLPLIAAGTPSQAVHQLLAQQTAQQSTIEVADRLRRCGGGASDLLAVLMDNEVRFMRRSLLSGSSASSRATDEIDGGVEESELPAQRQSWAASNLERSQWLSEILQPVVESVGVERQGDMKLNTELSSRFALTAMAGSLAFKSQPSSDAHASILPRLSAQLRLLVEDVSLADHWCLRNSAGDAWQIWFTRALRDAQHSGPSGGSDGDSSGAVVSASDAIAATASAGHQLVSVLREALRSSHIPAHMANALYALSGLVKAAASVDQNLGSELSMLASSIIVDLQLVPFTAQSPDEFWLQSASALNGEVLAAAIECAGLVAIANSHDQATLCQISQFLMAGLMLSVGGGGGVLPPVAVQAIARSLTSLHTLLFTQKISDTRSFSEDVVVVEADDIRRCVERLDILQTKSADPKRDANVVDLGSVGLAMALAVMHRQWISRLINPAMSEQNATPRAAQALREIARTLGAAYQNLKLAEDGHQLSSQSVASLYYLSFVWPPRPITQRHIELHGSLFVVTPDRVWQAATRLVRKLWSPTDDEAGKLGTRRLDYINCIELATSTLAYHLAMTAGQGVAPSAHIKLVKLYSEWVRGETDGVLLAANEKPSVRANRAVALAILLGVPMHGVPETTVSNEYLPVAQQRLLPALLGVGSVQYGSTAWLRMPESALQSSLGALLGCSGLSQYLDGAGGGDAMAGELDVGDVRSAQAAAFVVGGLLAQSSRAVHLLGLQQREESLADGSKDKITGDNAPQTKAEQVTAETATAASEEPKTLGRLPAPTSWCRAVWENITELSESLSGSGGSVVVEAVECKMVYLLTAMLKAARPFPVVDSRKVFGRLLGVYLELVDASSLLNKRLPVLALVLSTAGKLGPVSYSMAQFVTEAVQQIVSKAVDASSTQIAANQYVDGEYPDSLVAIALRYLGSDGFGRILSLSGFVGSSETSEHAWILDSTALYAKKSLAAAVAGMAPRALQSMDSPVESDAARMFRIMSKVAVPPPKAANVCASILATLFDTGVNGDAEVHLPLLVSLRTAALATLQAHTASENLVDVAHSVARTAAREKITAEVAQLVPSSGHLADLQTCGGERALLLWSVLGVAFCGINKDRGMDMLRKAPGTLSDADFGRLVEQQALLLCQWIDSTTDVPAKSKQAGAKTAIANTTGVVGDWLKSTFKEWARRASHELQGADGSLRLAVPYSMQLVAGALYSKQRIRSGSADAQRMVVQGLDMVILAASIAGTKAPGVIDEFIATGVVCWLLPLLTGLGAQDILSHPGVAASGASRQALVIVAIDEMLEHLERGSTNAGHAAMANEQQQPMRQYSVQLRTRVLGLLDLTKSAPSRRALRPVLVRLAQLGMLPLSDLQRVV
ncbi:hypothetical protein GGH91_000381 [Coemansia sp. RSA 2671]|nr:hypothetical protein LPJ60_000900 [Coemansia sp. RSA 2675]KAJ2350129.1 hypothetical protein GGH91_000381 [Coemansia sp. RSA 2671]